MRTKLPPSANRLERIGLPILRKFFYFYFCYLPYAPVRRWNKVDLNGPYLWASSHSNYLCDCIPAGCEGPAPTRFLAKSTLFKFPIKGFIEFAGALPVTRPEDVRAQASLGEQRSSQNRATFRAAIGALEKGWPVAIFPEGTSIVAPGLVLPLKSGIVKMALAAEELHHFSLGLRIVPVGLEYGSRVKVGSGLNIRYGRPLTLSDYADRYQADKEAAQRALLTDLTREMVGVFPHFQDETKRLLGRKLVTLGIFRYRYDVAQVFLRKEKDGAFWAGLEQRMRAFEEANKEHRIPLPAWGHRRVWKELGPKRRRARALFLVLGAPLALLELVNNTLPEIAVSALVEQLTVDETEKMTVRFMLAPFVVSAVLGLQFWAAKHYVFEEALAAAGWGSFLLYVVAAVLLWHLGVHWKKQAKRVASLAFFRRAGVDGRSQVSAYHRALRNYLGDLPGSGRPAGRHDEGNIEA